MCRFAHGLSLCGGRLPSHMLYIWGRHFLVRCNVTGGMWSRVVDDNKCICMLATPPPRQLHHCHFHIINVGAVARTVVLRCARAFAFSVGHGVPGADGYIGVVDLPDDLAEVVVGTNSTFTSSGCSSRAA